MSIFLKLGKDAVVTDTVASCPQRLDLRGGAVISTSRANPAESVSIKKRGGLVVRFYRGTREIKPKKLTNVDWRKAGYKSFAEFQGDVSSLKAEVEASSEMSIVEKRCAEQKRDALDRQRYHDLRVKGTQA